MCYDQSELFQTARRLLRWHHWSHVCADENAWRLLKDYDVEVATPKTGSHIEKEVNRPHDPSIFNILFFDEAHHTPAKTWNTLLSLYTMP